MKRPNSSLRLGKTFNENITTLGASLREFVKSADPASTQSLRKAIRRVSVSYSVMPKSLRDGRRFKRFVNSLRRLSKATGKVRDLDTITAWAAEATEGRDWRAVATDLAKLRASSVYRALSLARDLEEMKAPYVDAESLRKVKVERRLEKIEKRVVKRIDEEFDDFLSSQEVGVMHALRKDSKRLRHLLELSKKTDVERLLARLRSIQDDLGAIRDHDLEIEYLRSRARLTSSRSLIREEIAKRHAKLEEFMTKNRGTGRLVTLSLEGTPRA